MIERKITCILVGLMFITISLSVSGSDKVTLERSSSLFNMNIAKENFNLPSTNVLVRIDTINGFPRLPRDIEILGGKPSSWIDIIIPQDRLYELLERGIDYSVIIWNVDSYSQSFAYQYHTFDEMEQMLCDIAEDYPDITSLNSIGKSYEGRDIWCLEISDNPSVDEGEPGVFYMGLHLAREWPTLEICLYIADNLTSQYGTNPDITDAINNRRLWLVPCVNPDGYHYCHDLGNDWRKNRHYFPDFSITGTWGVDLNRNYGGSCNGDAWGSWGSLGPGSASHVPSSEVYCGPFALSELETQTIRDVFLQNDICASITWHTHGQLVMWPWGYSANEVTPDDEYMAYVGTQIASRIANQNGIGNYTPTQSSGLYPTTGDTTDWAYGYGHYVQGRPTFSYTIEACSSFHPMESNLDQICRENFDGALYLLREAENIKNNVTPRVIPPEIDEIFPDSDGNYTVSWVVKNIDAKHDYFQLDEMTNLSIVIDDVESGSDLWLLDGFSIVNSKFHSNSSSYKSRKNNTDISSMTSVYPIPIEEKMKLSFWCYYNIEKNRDCAFVEVSLNGRSYVLLDTFTGSSNGWTYKEYDLDDFVGDSVFVRFRHTTDYNILEDGFYVDDISPVADFSSVNTLSSYIDNNYFEINSKPKGTYYYRLRGHNSEHEWGDFSTLKKINVAVENNEPPKKPIINGPTSGNINIDYTYTASTTDPNGDKLYYLFDWDDGKFSEWIGPYNSGETAEVSHKWNKKGDYEVRVKSKDVCAVESEWSDSLPISMPKIKSFKMLNIELLLKLVDRFPLFEKMFTTMFLVKYRTMSKELNLFSFSLHRTYAK